MIPKVDFLQRKKKRGKISVENERRVKSYSEFKTSYWLNTFDFEKIKLECASIEQECAVR